MSNGRFTSTKTFSFEGGQHTVKELSDRFGLNPSVLHKRLSRNDGDVARCVYGVFDTHKFVDMLGQKYGRLTVIRIAGRNRHGQIEWNCACECGGYSVVVGSQLRYGITKSCGCLHRELTSAASTTHGMSKTPIYAIWHSMVDRCHLSSSHAYDRYGARGIKVCARWRDFENFYADMGNRPEGMSLERIDNDGDYSPDNVKWATQKEQANNRRCNVKYQYGDEELTLAQWADRGMVCIGTLWSRLQRGVPFPICLLNIDLRQMRGRFA